ncbi:hypothetical protein MJ584_13380 [Klebsiella pneumoniae]|nr:hypothetical protein MJ584_13380 [Klebsiella pneumoniae]
MASSPAFHLVVQWRAGRPFARTSRLPAAFDLSPFLRPATTACAHGHALSAGKGWLEDRGYGG